MRLVKLLLVALLLATSFSGCYRMPSDDEYCTIPTVNNPDVTRARDGGGMPGMSY